MHFGLREITASISAAALIFCCSCEKHRLGEDPEVQKENVETEHPAAANKAEPAENAAAKPTPAQFFPENSPSP
jgi:hypothetical protein